VCGQSIIHNYFNFFLKEDCYVQEIEDPLRWINLFNFFYLCVGFG